MKIVKLSAENIKRLQAVEVTPEGDLVVVGGKNDAGKSSLLDAIEMALGGEGATPAQPVRRGQHKAKVVVDLGDIVVTREFAAGGQRKLVVSNKDGARYPSPQAMLDKLYSRLTFDPLAFERQDAKRQAETLRALVGLDTSDLDGKRQRLYDERTQANREVKALEVKADSHERYPDAPAAEVSIVDLVLQMKAAELYQQAALKADHVFENESRICQQFRDRFSAVIKKIEELRTEADSLEVCIRDQEKVMVAARDEAERKGKAVPNVEMIRGRIAEAEGLNEQVRTNRQHTQAQALLADARKTSDGLTAKIEALDNERIARLAAVAYPVEGLGIADEGVLLNGLPFEQASTSDRIRVSVAIGLAMNPQLRVLLVRDGSLLGDEKLKLLAEMAKAADAQVWLEMLQEAPDGRTSVYIEDGSVKAAPGFAKENSRPVLTSTSLSAVQEELL